MKKVLRKALILLLIMALCMTGCSKAGGDNTPTDAGIDTTGQPSGNEAVSGDDVAPSPVTQDATLDGTADNSETSSVPADGSLAGIATDASVAESTDRYIKVGLNVYYNDADHGYYANEAPSSIIYCTEPGTYAASFDCATDLSAEAKAAGVTSLRNMTAVYLLDMGNIEGHQSPITACSIKYERVIVDGTDLTVTQTEPKSALKSTGIFDTNDPINAWDGSQVEEVAVGSDHDANFTTVANPTRITVVFTLSDMKWDGEEVQSVAETENTPASGESTTGFVNPTVYSDMDFTNITALEVSKLMGNGINLGNTMEAYGHATLGIKSKVSAYETYWGQPITTAEMLKGMKNCGFDTIRIPVAWTNMMDYENGDYTIDKAYLDRVQEIVDYAIAAEMFVVVNDHWDGGWWAMFGSSNPESAQNAFTMYTSMWTQIAERFKDYPDLLVLESANEELGNSLNNNSTWADSGSLTENQCFELTNKINQTFVDTVRAAGGNNDDRFLLIAGYNTDFDHTFDARYHMPEDSAKSKLLLSVHYYTPWNYCGAENDSRWGIAADYKLMDEQFTKLKKFTDAGYGVIIGEYGALPYWENNVPILKQNTYEFTEHFLDNCDVYNVVPLLWSCNDFFNKKTLTMIDESLLNLYVSRCYAAEKEAGDGYPDTVNTRLREASANAPEMWDGVETYEAGTPVAWIMWNGGAGTYSVGDAFNPADNTAGITATNTIVDGAGEYTVSLDFAGGNTGITFAALAIADCELLYPNAVILIEEITYDGNPVKLTATPYTNSDDGKCTRVNLYNEWVSELPADARAMGSLKTASPCILDKTEINDIRNITIKFRLIVK